MSKILIINMHDEKPNYVKVNERRIDRVCALGNPFFMENDVEREKACDKYKVWFDLMVDPLNMCSQAKRFRAELAKLLHVYKECRVLKLYCWCAPKRCHAETIRDWLIQHSK